MQYDVVIVGAGIFGTYAALYLAQKDYRVLLLEKEKEVFRKASIVNQARLHGGYHYPRSIATAVMSDENKERFTQEHRDFINFSFDKYYAIDRYGSFTDAAQFERFCQYLGIRCEPVHRHPLFNYDRLEALYLTTEYSFDPILIADHYRQRLQKTKGIDLKLGVELQQAQAQGQEWYIEFKGQQKKHLEMVTTPLVINATYAGSNTINELFGTRSIDLMHEISEIAFIHSPQVQNMGLTVMDGPFGSIMPYGNSGLLSLSSVPYTHHKVSYENQPEFTCMGQANTCRPDYLDDCNHCPAQPATNYRKMLKQMGRYFSDQVEWNYFSSFFTIKSKLQANFIDDGRPTEIRRLREKPDFYCIFAGKINSIYEIERLL